MILKHPISLLATLAAGVCMLVITAAASSTNVNDNADELALYCTWSPDYACAPGAFTFTASASCDGEVPNPTQMISISAIGAITGQANGFNEVTLVLTNVPPGAVTVTFSGAGESHTVTVWSLKVDIVQERVEYCVHHGADTLDLTEESYLGPDTACWYRNGLYAGAGHSHTLTPSAMEPGTYTVIAEAAALPACKDTCTVHIVKVDLSVAGVDDDVEDVAPGGLVCVNSGQTATRTELTINKCQPADWDGSVELLWIAGNVKVYNVASNGVEMASGAVFTNAALPTNLWVEGTAPSAAAGDIVFRLNPVGLECPNAAEGCDKVVMTAIGVEITPSSMTATESLDSGTFTCTVTPSDIRPLYQWLAGSDNGAWPATAGNIPELDYSAPTASNTTIKATRWFAPTPSRRQVIDGTTASYSINCMVTIGGVEFYARPSSVLKVRVNMTGQCIRPMFAGWQSIQVQQFGAVWRVTGQGGFRRTDPIPSVNMPATSQFYFKAMTHENKHVTQWMTEAPWKDLFDADSLYVTTLSSLTSNVSETDLRNQIFAAVSAAYTADNTVANSTVCDREQGAFDAMNAVEPHFLELDEVDWRPLYGCP